MTGAPVPFPAAHASGDGDADAAPNGPFFDAHLHISAPGFPLIPNQGYTPDFFTVDDYLARARPLGITGGAVVSGSFQ
jgi:predicted TIM-barrel fold metal-dependent hydrolase